MGPVTQFVGRTFFRIVRRWPTVFAGVAGIGLTVGVWAVGFLPARNWMIVGIGVLCLVFYSGLLVLLIVKLWRGTWVEFCDSNEALFDPNTPSFQETIQASIREMSAQILAFPCPRCGRVLGDKRPGRRTWTQVLWGGWTCPSCGCDVDRFGKERKVVDAGPDASRSGGTSQPDA
jgi:hypothetical protein